MRLQFRHYGSAPLAVCILLASTGQAQVTLFGPGLTPDDKQLLLNSVARLNAAEPRKIRRSESWSNPQMKSLGTSTVLRIFHSRNRICQLLRHRIIIAGRQPGHDYTLTWCRMPTGECEIQ